MTDDNETPFKTADAKAFNKHVNRRATQLKSSRKKRNKYHLSR